MLEIILIAPFVDIKSYREMQEAEKFTNPGQKFYELLFDGLAINGVKVKVYSIINEKFKTYVDSKTDIFYEFYNTESYLSKLKAYRKIAKQIKLKENSNSIIIADAEGYWTLKAAIKSRQLNKNKVIALITDFPHNVYSYSSTRNQKVFLDKLKALYAKQKLRIFRKADGFILLTKQMKEVVAGNKPWIVIEGFSDVTLKDNVIEDNNRNENIKNLVYLGALNGKSGILDLIIAFINIKKENIRLDIYGDGVFTDQIIEYSHVDSRINYCGVVSLDKIIKIEKKAHFLINPRPSKQEFNKFSFPSKTIEYMSSGTPVITTKLEGIPKEYDDYLYFIDDCDIDTMTKQIIEIIEIDDIKLLDKGRKAKAFVLEKKDNITQSKKIIEFIYEQFKNS